MAVEDAFDDVVSHYDDWVRKAVPKCDEFFELAASLIPFDARSSIDILDLGAGTGLFSFHVWNKYKSAKYVLCDLAPKMLSAAKQRFQYDKDSSLQDQLEWLKAASFVDVFYARKLSTIP